MNIMKIYSEKIAFLLSKQPVSQVPDRIGFLVDIMLLKGAVLKSYWKEMNY